MFRSSNLRNVSKFRKGNGLKTAKKMKTFDFLVILGSFCGSFRTWNGNWFSKSLQFRFCLLLNVITLLIYEISNENRFSEIIFGFSTHLGHSDYLVNYSFLSKELLQSLMDRLELHNHFVSQTTKFVKKRKLSIFYTIFGSHWDIFQTQICKYLPQKPTAHQLHFLLSHFNLTLERFQKFTNFARKRIKFQFYFPTHLSFWSISDVNHCNFLIKKENYITDSFAFDCFEPNSQNFSKIVLK